NMKFKSILLIFFAATIAVVTGFTSKKNYQKGKPILIKDSTGAVRVATTIWQNIYGPEIMKEQPFKAFQINDSIWAVRSTFSFGDLGAPKKGGSAYIELNKYTCEVLRVTKGK
ncbi:MAG: hypothetical protein J7539_17070, partial [Niabella sp.]|nr:hypothetical protein [Niabella sp.]